MKLDCVVFDGEAEIQREGIDRRSRGKGEFNRVLARRPVRISSPLIRRSSSTLNACHAV